MVIGGESINYSIRNLKARKARSFLTILSIFVGIATIFIFIGFGLGLFNYVNELTTGSSADKIIIQTKGVGAPGLDDTFTLTESDLRAVSRVGGVYEAIGVSFKVAEVQKQDEKRFNYVVGYDPKNMMLFEISDIGLEEGRFLSTGETGKALLGYNYRVPNTIFTKPVKLGDSIEIQGEKVRIVGFLEAVGSPPDDAQVYITNKYMEELYPKTIDTHSWIMARVEIDKLDRVVEDVEKAVRKNRGQEEGKEDFYVQSFEDLIESFSGALNVIIGFVILIALISVVVSAVNTAYTMITSVLERYKEIGVLKSIGARNSEILKIFLFESAFLGFLAGIFGVLVGFGVTAAANAILENLGWGFLQAYTPIPLFIWIVIFATFTGAISGMVPAYRASKINAVDALRYE